MTTTLPGLRPRSVRIVYALALCCLLAWMAVPIYNMAQLALTPFTDLYQAVLFPENPSLESFAEVIRQSNFNVEYFWRQFGNSAAIAMSTTIINLTVATMASFAIDRLRPRWAGAVSNTALITYIIPIAFLAIPLFKVMDGYGLLNTRPALILACVAWTVPYCIWMFIQYSSQAIPRELDEAAAIDGANSWRRYRWLYVPIMKPALLTGGTYSFMFAWNEYLLAYTLLNDVQIMTVPVSLSRFLNTDQPDVNVLMAASILYAIVPIVIFGAFFRQITTGITAGATKG